MPILGQPVLHLLGAEPPLRHTPANQTVRSLLEARKLAQLFRDPRDAFLPRRRVQRKLPHGRLSASTLGPLSGVGEPG
jgi:hypothetical protein